MSLTSVANEAVQWWDRDTAITMTAIAGAESGYSHTARGDHIANFDPFDQALYDPYDCDGYLSHGPWQVFLGVHHGRILNMSGIDDPCGQANWLYDVGNAARAAASILQDQGFGAWSVFNGGQYQAYLFEATQAVDAALEGAPPPSEGEPGTVSNLQVDQPVCSDNPYGVVLYWNGTNSVLWLDISEDPGFSWWINKEVSGQGSTNAPSGFSEFFEFYPGVAYYWRLWNGDQHFLGPGFAVPVCTTAPPEEPDPVSDPIGYLQWLGCLGALAPWLLVPALAAGYWLLLA